jgi:hypothetical protein
MSKNKPSRKKLPDESNFDTSKITLTLHAVPTELFFSTKKYRKLGSSIEIWISLRSMNLAGGKNFTKNAN